MEVFCFGLEIVFEVGMYRTYWCFSFIENFIVFVGRRVFLGCFIVFICCFLILIDLLGCRVGFRDVECFFFF